MNRPRFLKLLRITTSVLVAALACMSVAVVLFFRHMSKGQLRSSPPGGSVTVSFSDGPDVYRVMLDICHDTEVSPMQSREDYDKLLATGILVRVPDRTPIYLEERGYRAAGFKLSSITFANGSSKGKSAWTCPNSAVWNTALP
jgi:hypothetical protein